MRVKESMSYCSRCFNITETDPCPICSNPSRDQETICVVEEPLDMLVLEKTGVYKGLYHVLHGALSPINGIGHKDVRIDELLTRLKEGKTREVLSGFRSRAGKPFRARLVLTEEGKIEFDFPVRAQTKEPAAAE